MGRPRRTREEAIERFFECVKLPPFEDLFKPSVLGPCWLWTAALSQGYGHFSYQGRNISAHRFAWTVVMDRPLPKAKQLDHLCRVRACVNPLHLEPVAQSLNLRRMEVANADRNSSRCRLGHRISNWVHFTKRGCAECRQFWSRKKREKEAALELATFPKGSEEARRLALEFLRSEGYLPNFNEVHP